MGFLSVSVGQASANSDECGERESVKAIIDLCNTLQALTESLWSFLGTVGMFEPSRHIV